MKHLKYISIVAAGMLALSSCTDDFVDTMSVVNVEKPNTMAQLEYLNAYKPLKEYLANNARSINPNFLLGTAISLSLIHI